MKLTVAQARRALFALDNVEIARAYRARVWEREALARLRWHLLAIADLPPTHPYFDRDPKATLTVVGE